jgi:signal transduction histidine kinase
VVSLSGAALVGLAWACGVTSISALSAALLVVGASAAWAMTRVARAQAEIAASVDSVGQRLVAWADGTAATEVVERPETSTLVAACSDLVGRLEHAEKDAARHRAAAQEADRERLAFLADFSHELRTPLNSILGFAHVLESGSEGPLGPEGVEAIGIIVASGEQLKTLVEDVLDLTALETGALELAPRPVDLGELATEVTRTAQLVANQKKLVLAISVAPGVFARGDEKRLRRILWNLLSRGIRATEAGAVDVEVKAIAGEGDSARARFTVRDAGKPLSKLEREALVHGMLDEATTREGIGIGLAVAGRLVRRLGGVVDILTLEPGTSIAVELPLATAEEIAWADKSRPSMRGQRPPTGEGS